jgi:xanthine dehydrogenase YagS FAD-binding subunit
MIRIAADPKSAAEALAASPQAELRAGGTDLMDRRKRGISRGELVDIQRIPGKVTAWPQGLRLDATLSIAALTELPELAPWVGLRQAALGLATPQVRNMATLGGNLLQAVRCPYFRDAHLQCLQKGGATCYARQGEHIMHSALDLGPCIAPHPSTLALALLCWEAQAEMLSGEFRPLSAVLGDGREARPHRLNRGEMLAAVHLPRTVAGERSGWFRAIHRARAEWPLAEAVVRILPGPQPQSMIWVGGVAPAPLRLPAAEQALAAGQAEGAPLEAAVQKDLAGQKTVPGNEWKLGLLAGVIADAAARARGGA